MYIELEPRRDRRNDPPVTIYVINSTKPYLEKISCIYCKRTINDMKGRVDRIIDAPLDVSDYGIAINVMCKQCHQFYRFVTNANDH
jgi:hypothetical protein